MAKTHQTWEQRVLREQAQTVVDKALEILLSQEGDIPWQGFGLVGRLVDFLGEIPASSGYHEVDTMPSRVDRMRSWPRDYREALEHFQKLTKAQSLALAFDRARRGRDIAVAHDPFRGDLVVHYDDTTCARELGCSVSQFRDRVYSGYKRLEALLSLEIHA